MNIEGFKQFVRDIVEQAKQLKNAHTQEKEAPVNYACVFSQSEEEYQKFQELADLL